jgi:hypothetical protein
METAAQIRVQHVLPIPFTHPQQQIVSGNSGIIHQNVDGRTLRQNPFAGIGNFLEGRHVNGQMFGGKSPFAQLAGHFATVGLRFAHTDHMGTGLGEKGCDGFTDASSGPGDHTNFSK